MKSRNFQAEVTALRAVTRASRWRRVVRWLTPLLPLTALLTSSVQAADAASCAASTWPLWQSYVSRYVQADGRMLGSSMDPLQSSSEGQSYGMFFALVGNDPATFDKVWQWTKANLAGSDVGSNLPGWLWGRDKDGKWGLLDASSASDSDLWLAYALLEAARLWQRPDYHTDALQLLGNVRKTLVLDLPGLGKTLIPGPVGYVHPDHLWRLNPSYMPIPLMRRFSKEEPAGPWKDIAESTGKLIRDASPKGFVADWVGYRGTSEKSGLFVVDPFTSQLGSYDAIRVYLWAGMTPKSDPLAAPILAHLDGMVAPTASTGIPPEKVQTLSGATDGTSPFGFSAALIPYFQAKGLPWLADMQQHVVENALKKAMDPADPAYNQPVYYNFMLSLFALGWVEKRFEFLNDGSVKLSWESACPRAATR